MPPDLVRLLLHLFLAAQGATALVCLGLLLWHPCPGAATAADRRHMRSWLVAMAIVQLCALLLDPGWDWLTHGAIDRQVWMINLLAGLWAVAAWLCYADQGISSEARREDDL